MRENKWIILICLPVTIAALFLAMHINQCGLEFWCNVLLGIFGSGLLTTMVAIVNYFVIRKRTLMAFWSYGHKVINNLNRYSADDDLNTAIDVFLQMAEFDYQPFDDAFDEMSFLFRNKKTREEIYKRIYVPIMEIRDVIGEKRYHFRTYKKTVNGNRRVMEDFVNEIDKLLIERKEYGFPKESKEDFLIHTATTYKVHNLRIEFNDYFYYIMYPWKKKEASNDAH